MCSVPLTRTKKQELVRFRDKINKTSVRALQIRAEILGQDEDDTIENFVTSSILLANNLTSRLGPEEERGENKFMINGIKRNVRKENLKLFINASLQTNIGDFHVDRERKLAFFTCSAEVGVKG